MSGADPTYLGRVSLVSGASITVKLAESLASGMAIIGGHAYRVGQVGSFVRIPLSGLIRHCRRDRRRCRAPSINGSRSGNRALDASGACRRSHWRGLSQHPNIDDAVHIVIEADLRRIYGGVDEKQVAIGTLFSAENIAVRLSLDNLVTRHSAILGSTGSGKSTTVASLLRSIVMPGGHEAAPGARILLLDVHGEYAAALSDVATVFSATPQPGEDHSMCHTGHWRLAICSNSSRVTFAPQNALRTWQGEFPKRIKNL